MTKIRPESDMERVRRGVAHYAAALAARQRTFEGEPRVSAADAAAEQTVLQAFRYVRRVSLMTAADVCVEMGEASTKDRYRRPWPSDGAPR